MHETTRWLPLLGPALILAALLTGLDNARAQSESVIGNLCVGTSCVASETFGETVLKLKDINNRLTFEDDSALGGLFPRNDWQIEANSSSTIDTGGQTYLRFNDLTANRPLFTIRAGAPADSLYIAQDGGVGFGLSDPLAPIHVLRENATQEFILLESNQAGGAQDRAMIQLVNNGGIRFQFDNPLLGTSWRFQAATGNADNFEIAKVGTGEIEFRVDADGNAYLAGLVFENSDRDAKTNITPIDPEAVLEKVMQLPIKQWAYKESPESNHIGPMAQDFHAAFRTGDSDKRLATMDGVGVAIASIQALNAKNVELEARNRELESSNAALEARVEKLESLEREIADLRAVIGQLLPQVVRN